MQVGAADSGDTEREEGDEAVCGLVAGVPFTPKVAGAGPAGRRVPAGWLLPVGMPEGPQFPQQVLVGVTNSFAKFCDDSERNDCVFAWGREGE